MFSQFQLAFVVNIRLFPSALPGPLVNFNPATKSPYGTYKKSCICRIIFQTFEYNVHIQNRFCN